MLYPKSTEECLSPELFRNPTSEYRGTPFWAWNCKLTPDLLLRQIECFKQMGLGGFHMHSRTGMATPYLSGEFMELVKTCVEKARQENMLAWLYDEDRWPSGAAGGIVTKNPEYRARYLMFTPVPYGAKATEQGSLRSASEGQRTENGTLLARYDVRLRPDGTLDAYRQLAEGETGENLWYAYLEVSGTSPWYNNQTYVNTLDKNAIDEFIRVTYESYKKAVGSDFGGVVPAIFTDEPQFSHKTALAFAADKKDVFLPWTDDLPQTYEAAYGEALLPRLPELFWELACGEVSVARYHYHDHIAQRFTEAFADNCGKWCRENGLMLTGHMMEEPTLKSQTAALGEAMRSYRGFDLPGIDMLSDSREYTTAKQAQSAAHQFGCPGVLSELYGVTNWDFDFRGHKLQGDWQAALGVTVRVPHLSWVSMAGEAKRDYPASISYQSPWHREYPLIENHFARVHTALTRGKPHVRVGVVHPVESYWLYWGPQEQTESTRRQLDDNFKNITDWLLFGQIDFDFISESLLPQQCEAGGAPLKVGKMAYDAVIVPDCRTLRASTVQRLEAFAQAGGQLIVLGSLPEYVDALPACEKLTVLEQAAQVLPFQRNAVLTALEPVRSVEIRNAGGVRVDNLLTQMRDDGDARWLFIANGTKPANPDVMPPEKLFLRIRGEWSPVLYDTMTGETMPLPAASRDGFTVVERTMYGHDSLLLRLEPGVPVAVPAVAGAKTMESAREGWFGKAPVLLSEPNVLLLDTAEYSFDGGAYRPQEEILRLDNEFREKLGYPTRMEAVAQPWVIAEEVPEHTLGLHFTIISEVEVRGISLALEDAASARIRFNGQAVTVEITGYYVDESIKTVPLPDIRRGENTLELVLPFGRRTNAEYCYLLGDFGVRVEGTQKTVTAPVRKLAFGDYTTQGLPFYGGNVTYLLEVEGKGEDVTVHVPMYRGELVGVELDGIRVGTIAFAPYSAVLPALAPGMHELGLTLFGNRVNTFGCVHNADESWTWFGPPAWRTTGDAWMYEYRLTRTGILKSPTIY